MRVAAVQMCSGPEPAANAEAAERLVREAAAAGAGYVQIPEYSTYLGRAGGNEAAAEELSGTTAGRFRHIARELGIVLHVGSMLERSGVPGKCYNTGLVIDAAGEIAAVYRKVHLFDIDVPGQVVERESASIEPGSGLRVATMGELRVGMSICFDLRFPELYRQLALAGANVLAIPAAFSVPTGRVHWEVLVRARAIENHAFVVAAAQAGTTSEAMATYGHSLVVGPWGEILAEGNGEKEEVLVVDLDLSEVPRRRSQIDVLGLRRPDAYRVDPAPGEPVLPGPTK